MKNWLLLIASCIYFIPIQAQHFDCSKFRLGRYIMEDTLDGEVYRFLIERTEKAQKEVLLSYSGDMQDYMPDTIHFHVDWNDKKCQYTLWLDSVRTKRSVLSEAMLARGKLLVDITAQFGSCFHFKTKSDNAKMDYKGKMCRLEEDDETLDQSKQD